MKSFMDSYSDFTKKSDAIKTFLLDYLKSIKEPLNSLHHVVKEIEKKPDVKMGVEDINHIRSILKKMEDRIENVKQELEKRNSTGMSHRDLKK